MYKDFTQKILSFLPDEHQENDEHKIYEDGFRRFEPYDLVWVSFFNQPINTHERFTSPIPKLDSLTTIHISVSFFDDYFMTLLCNSLETNKSVSYLSLESNNLRDNGATKIGTMLLRNNTITSLGIGGNQITDNGMSLIISSLKKNTNLGQLIAVNNRFTERTIFQISEVLKVNKGLSKIMVGNDNYQFFKNDIFQYKLQHQLLASLSDNFKICYLDILNCLSTTSKTQQIILRFNQNNNLRYFYPRRFLMTPNELLFGVLVPLRNYQYLKKIPDELKKSIFVFLGVSFKKDVSLWKKDILSIVKSLSSSNPQYLSC